MRITTIVLGGALSLASGAQAQEARTYALNPAASEASVETDAYPAESLKLREQGTVHYQVEIDRDGELKTCEVTKSSGYYRLDAATCNLLVRQARFTAKVDAEGKPIRWTLNGKIVWKLPQG